MFLVMGVSLYTSRLILQYLGVEDYGIYNIVGGFVLLMSFLNSAMASASQRYISYDLGKGNYDQVQKTFSSTLVIHFLLAGCILLLGEPIGLWYINKVMVYPIERQFAVNVVFQFSLLSFILNVIQVPYNALIMAHEKMNVYAYMGLLEALLKLLIVFIVGFFSGDKLMLYSLLVFIVALIVRILYQIYCRVNFKESHFFVTFDKVYLRELLSYSSWNILGNLASVLRLQGNNVVLNLFKGVVVNSAYGLSMQVNSSISTFVSNFQSAFNPQIIKKFASGEVSNSIDMAFYASKFSFFIMLLVVVPVYFNLDFIVTAWLTKVPTYTLDFMRINLLLLLVDSLSGPLMTLVTATGKIKYYQIVIGSFMLLCVPLSFIFLKLGYSPTVVFYIMLIMGCVVWIMRVLFVQSLLKIDIKKYFISTVLRLILISAIIFIIYKYSAVWRAENWTDLFISSIIWTFILGILIAFIGMNSNDRKLLFKLIIR
jgi:O-antigen/teichoic acid export membrane protein